MIDLKIIRLFLIFLLFLPITVHADKWSRNDKARQAIYVIGDIIDWRQTLKAIEQPDKYYEINPILGKYPTRGEVNVYSVVSLSAHFIIADILNSKWRARFQIATISIKAGLIVMNFSYGLGI